MGADGREAGQVITSIRPVRRDVYSVNMESSGPRENWEIPFVGAQREGPSLVTSDVKWVMVHREETMPEVVF